MLLTPANTPEFSPIENMFSFVKKRLKFLAYEDQKQVAMEVAKTMFMLEQKEIRGFWRRTLGNMLDFWSNK